jgi:transcriptional regulator with XRE-family HTH domain
MGANVRPRPRNLSRKLLQIRIHFKLSQSEMVGRLGFRDSLHVGRISEYERGLREPSLVVLLGYARLAQIHLEELVDDNIDLPERLPSRVSHRGSRRKAHFCPAG